MSVNNIPWEQSLEFIHSSHRNTDEFQPETIRTIWISEEEVTKAFVGKLKGKDTTEIVSYLFMLEKGWNFEKAKEWFKKHQENLLMNIFFASHLFLKKHWTNLCKSVA